MPPKAVDFTHIPRVVLAILLINFALWFGVLPLVVLARGNQPNWTAGYLMFLGMIPLAIMMMFIWRLLIYFWYIAFWYVQGCLAIFSIMSACALLGFAFTNHESMATVNMVAGSVNAFAGSSYGGAFMIVALVSGVVAAAFTVPKLLRKKPASTPAPTVSSVVSSPQSTAPKPWYMP